MEFQASLLSRKACLPTSVSRKKPHCFGPRMGWTGRAPAPNGSQSELIRGKSCRPMNIGKWMPAPRSFMSAISFRLSLPYGPTICSTASGQRRRKACSTSPAGHAYRSSGRNCVGACGCALACDDTGVGKGLRAPTATCGCGADVLDRGFCSEALAISCATCS